MLQKWHRSSRWSSSRGSSDLTQLVDQLECRRWGGGFTEKLEDDSIGWLCMLNRRKYTGDGHAWKTVPDMELESLRRRGGVRILGRGVREKGVRTNPPNPPGYGPMLSQPCFHQNSRFRIAHSVSRWTPRLGLAAGPCSERRTRSCRLVNKYS